MFKNIINCLLFAVTTLIACACTNKEKFSPTLYDELEIECTLPVWDIENTLAGEISYAPTKTIRTETGTTYWLPNDKINIFQGAAGGSKFTAQNTEPSQITQFKGTLTAVTGNSESTSSSLDFWGVYPYNATNTCDGHSVTLSVHDIQTSIAGSFAKDEFPSIGTSPNLAISFYNVCGGIYFTVTKSGISKITFKGNNDEDIAGKVRVKFGDDGKPVVESILDGKKKISIYAPTTEGFEIGSRYYMSILPTMFSNGFSLTFTQIIENEEGHIETYEGIFIYPNNVTFERSYFNGLTDRDASLEFHKVEEDENYEDNIPDPITLTSTGNTAVVFTNTDNALEYKKNNDVWTHYTSDTPICLSDGETLQFRAREDGNITSYVGKVGQIIMAGSGTIEASGNIMSLVDRTRRTTLNADEFEGLFSGCTQLSDASQLILPATTLADYCYASMFSGCSSLVNAPELPATTLADYCYEYMFSRCSSLVNAPELPATTLADYCYADMFYGCSSLVNAPELPATTLADYCYAYMFYDCSSLVNAPELPATTLAVSCYKIMFKYCSRLNHIKMLATELYDNSALYEWTYGVASTGTFIKSKEATWNEYDIIPSGWTVIAE